MEGINSPVVHFVHQGDHGLRLDAALAPLLPGLGLRGRRRLWDWRLITVNGRPRPPGFAVSAGDLIRVEERPDSAAARSGESAQRPGAAAGPPGDGVRLVALDADFAALGKPAGLHSARLAGGGGPSLEELLPALWARLQAEAGLSAPSVGGPPPRLLTRLDAATSGIVLAARSEEAAGRFRQAERRGEVDKSYFALLRGRLLQPLLIRNRLDTNGRARTLVMDEDDPDSTRHTLVTPLRMHPMTLMAATEFMPDGDERAGPGGAEGEGKTGSTLVRVRIRRGARHQIRAHLAWAGFPLAGEWLYPLPVERRPGARLYLHHARVEFAGFFALDPPNPEWRIFLE